MVAEVRQRVYLETSFVSACVTTRTDPGSIFRRDVSRDWWKTQRKYFDVYVSDFVVQEVSDEDFKSRDKALELIAALPLLPETTEVAALASLLIREKVMPKSLKGDAGHVASATVHAMEFMLSWNVRHLANPNKVRHLQAICRKLGYVPPQIVTPDSVWKT